MADFGGRLEQFNWKLWGSIVGIFILIMMALGGYWLLSNNSDVRSGTCNSVEIKMRGDCEAAITTYTFDGDSCKRVTKGGCSCVNCDDVPTFSSKKACQKEYSQCIGKQ